MTSGDQSPKLTFSNSEFALLTIQERWPKILSQLIDSIYRNREVYCSNACKDISDKLKKLTRHVGQLRYDIMTNKPMTLLLSEPLGSAELQLWNQLLSNYGVKQKPLEDANCMASNVCWYDLPWLFAECYLYRRVIDVVLQSGLDEFDPFFLKKQYGLRNSEAFITSVLSSLTRLSDLSPEQAFSIFLHSSLWANEYDLSLNPDGEFQQTGFDQISDYIRRAEERTVVNDIDIVRQFCVNFSERMSSNGCNRKLRVVIVLDNAGPELVADLCLAEYFLASELAESVTFHGKCMPWFVSDVTSKDFNWLLNINTSNFKGIDDGQHIHWISKWSEIWRKRVHNGDFQFKTSYFWTLPCTYDEMEAFDSVLYEDLAKNYDLIIFKGDLNYRKLLGDRQWKPDNPMDKINAFRGVQIGRSLKCSCSKNVNNLKIGSPIANCSCGPMIITLRVAKSDVAVGLEIDCLTELLKKNKNWWTIGQYGFIQVVSPIVYESISTM